MPVEHAADELAGLLGRDVGVRLGLQKLLHLGLGQPLRGFRIAGEAGQAAFLGQQRRLLGAALRVTMWKRRRSSSRVVVCCTARVRMAPQRRATPSSSGSSALSIT